MANIIVNVTEQIIDMSGRPAGLYLRCIVQTSGDEGLMVEQVVTILAPMIVKSVKDVVREKLGLDLDLSVESVVQSDSPIQH